MVHSGTRLERWRLGLGDRQGITGFHGIDWNTATGRHAKPLPQVFVLPAEPVYLLPGLFEFAIRTIHRMIILRWPG